MLRVAVRSPSETEDRRTSSSSRRTAPPPIRRHTEPGSTPWRPGDTIPLGATRTLRVVEVRAVQATVLSSRVGPLVITSLVHGSHRLGGDLGYREDPQMGPHLIGAAVRWWHRRDVETSWNGVRSVDWETRRVHLHGPGTG